jgi:PBP1b-binding outer membrane lipoprotein LpoB
MTRIAGLLLVVLLLAGCGQGETTAMNHKFERLDFQMASLETINSAYNQQHFAKLTQQYIALVHEYEDQLSEEGSQAALSSQLGDGLNAYCLPCTGVLYIEARKL